MVASMTSKRIIISLIFITVVVLSYSYANTEEGKITDKSKEAGEANNMKVLKIKWQRLISDGQTCPRCGSTEAELKKAISALKQSLASLGIQVVLEMGEVSVAEFKKNHLQSNQIWLNDRLLEDWIGGKAGQSQCCDYLEMS